MTNEDFWSLWEQDADEYARHLERERHFRNRVWGSITVALVMFWGLVIWAVLANVGR